MGFMTKTQELSILRTAADTLGNDSYCGPWLRERLTEIEASIAADILPAMTLADARQTAAKLVSDAKEEAAEIVRYAQRDAENRVTSANVRATKRENDSRRSVERAIAALRDLSVAL